MSLQEEHRLPGWRVFEPTQMRGRFTRAVVVASRAPMVANRLTTRMMAADVLGALKDARHATLLSDENFLGPADDCFGRNGGFYPNARRNLRAVKGLIGGGEPSRVVLSIRNYATWWPSAYALLGIRRDMPDIATLVSGWIETDRRWPEVVADAMAVFGSCDVVCYEALAADPMVLAKALVGDAASGAKEFRLHPSFSAEGLKALQAERTGEAAPPPEVMQAIRRKDRGRARLAPFSEEQRAALTTQYLLDLDRIVANGGKVIAPPPEWTAPATS